MSATTVQALLISGIGILLIISILADFIRQKVDLMSIRNIMLAGFIIYQVVSPAATLFTQETKSFRIDNLAGAGWQYIFLMVPFLLTFLIAYRCGWFVKGIAQKFPMYDKELSDGAMFVAAVGGVLLAMGARLAPAPTAIRYALFFLAMGSATMSTGVITWWWMRRPANVARASIAIFIILTNMMVITAGAFGRRPIIAVMLMFAWVVYYARIRYSNNRGKVVLWMLAAVSPMIVLASLFTSSRNMDNSELSSMQIAQLMVTEGNLGEGFVDLMGGQLVGEASLWCTETFPEHLPQDHLLSIRYYFVANIPRALWPNKPWVLSSRVAYLADIQNVRQDRSIGGEGVTLPPGIVGYSAAEGGLYAAIIYGLVLGLACRFLDQLVVNNVYRIGMVAPIAASLGNVMGLLRGDPSQFAMATTWSIVSSFLLLYLISSLLGRRTDAHTITIRAT